MAESNPAGSTASVNGKSNLEIGQSNQVDNFLQKNNRVYLPTYFSDLKVNYLRFPYRNFNRMNIFPKISKKSTYLRRHFTSTINQNFLTPPT